MYVYACLLHVSCATTDVAWTAVQGMARNGASPGRAIHQRQAVSGSASHRIIGHPARRRSPSPQRQDGPHTAASVAVLHCRPWTAQCRGIQAREQQQKAKRDLRSCDASSSRATRRGEHGGTPFTNTLRRGHDEDLRSHRDDSTLQQDFMGFIIPWPSPAQRQAEKGPRSARAGTSALRRLPFFHKITTPHHESCWLRPLSRLWLISWPLARGRALAIIILGATNCIYCLHSIYHSIYQIILSLFISLLRRRPRLFFRAPIDETPTFRVGSVSV
jgi:hypothetical protein